MTFKLGDEVRWKTRLGDYVGAREGKIIEVVPAGSRPATQPAYYGVGVGQAQRSESYVVETNNGIFWPDAVLLEPMPEARTKAELRLRALGMRSLDLDYLADCEPRSTPERIASDLEVIARILKNVHSERELIDASQHPRMDSACWRLADAGLRLRAIVEASTWTEVGGVHRPTGLGAVLPDPSNAPAGEIL